jgi:uncharacterized protein (DUF305 family)
MRAHHEGALSMSREYLSDPGRSSPLLQALARAIIANQTFEIRMLDEVARNLDRPPVRLGPFGAALQPQATEGLAGAQRFFKEPIPGPLAHAIGPVGERDVQFAKAMIVHHEGAVEMARAYHANPDARNGYLGLMNVDITTDQAQEIALMRRVIAAYAGDPEAVRVDPSMVHGMEGMRHGAHAAPPPGAAPPARAEDGHAGHRHADRHHAGHHHAGHHHHHRGHQGGHHAKHHHADHHGGMGSTGITTPTTGPTARGAARRRRGRKPVPRRSAPEQGRSGRRRPPPNKATTNTTTEPTARKAPRPVRVGAFPMEGETTMVPPAPGRRALAAHGLALALA